MIAASLGTWRASLLFGSSFSYTEWLGIFINDIFTLPGFVLLTLVFVACFIGRRAAVQSNNVMRGALIAVVLCFLVLALFVIAFAILLPGIFSWFPKSMGTHDRPPKVSLLAIITISKRPPIQPAPPGSTLRVGLLSQPPLLNSFSKSAGSPRAMPCASASMRLSSPVSTLPMSFSAKSIF